jgi:hypothetical protein
LKRDEKIGRRKLHNDLREREWGGMEWINLAQHRDQWRALVNTVMNLQLA